VSSGYIYIALERDVTPEFGAIERVLAGVGMQLVNVITQQVSALSPCGDQMFVTREWIVAQIAERRDVTIQWWYSGGEDLCCRFNPDVLAGRWWVEFFLDGVDDERVDALVERLLGYFKECCTRGDVRALVVDRSGNLEETDWDAVIAGREALRNVPDILVLPQGLVPPGLVPADEELSECPQHIVLLTSRAH
jgi:hypothetical protein